VHGDRANRRRDPGGPAGAARAVTRGDRRHRPARARAGPAADRGETALNLPWVADHVVPFLLLLGGLIFIHELGHFAVAKWLGVKVEKFSIGFGPSLFSRRVGETEYVIAALPLGGFVKMLGEIPGEELAPEEMSRAFNARPVWQRIAIALAGPVMNLLLPVFLIAAILMSGVPTPTSRIGSVDPGPAAA